MTDNNGDADDESEYGTQDEGDNEVLNAALCTCQRMGGLGVGLDSRRVLAILATCKQNIDTFFLS